MIMMEEYINTNFYKSAQPLTEEVRKRFNSLFENEKGIEKVEISREGILIEFNMYIYSEQNIAELLSNNGFIMAIKQKRGFIKRQIQFLADSNYKNYGNKKPDCC